MKNIFEGAKFGDKFLTRDGKIAIYHYYCGHIMNQHHLILEDGYIIWCKEDGHEIGYKESNLDIVSRYQESIDEEKLDELAYNYACSVSDYDEIVSSNDISAYKAGYRKAMED